MKKSYIAPNVNTKDIKLTNFITISSGDNDIDNTPIGSGSDIGAKETSIFDRVFENED